MSEKIAGVVGLGIMGGAFARNLLADGFEVHGFDLSKAARDAFAAAGGTVCDSPAAVADAAPFVVLSLPGVEPLAEVCSGAQGLTASRRKDLIAIECSTLPIEAKRAAHDALKAQGQTLLDCPVSGTGAQAAAKDLVVLASGDEAAYRRCQAVFEGMSRRFTHVGEFGNGMKMKIIANLLVTIHNVAAGEALALGQKAGLDPQAVLEAVQDGAGGSRMLQVRGPLMVANRYDEVTATIRTHMKDLGIISDFAKELGAALPVFAASAQHYYAGLAMGYGESDTAAVCAVSEALVGISRKPPPAN